MSPAAATAARQEAIRWRQDGLYLAFTTLFTTPTTELLKFKSYILNAIGSHSYKIPLGHFGSISTSTASTQVFEPDTRLSACFLHDV